MKKNYNILKNCRLLLLILFSSFRQKTWNGLTSAVSTTGMSSNPSKAIRLFLIGLFFSSFANAATYYSIVATGNFANPGSWSSSVNGAANTTPLIAGDSFVIQNNNTITLAAAQTVTNITVNSGGTLIIGGVSSTVSGTTSVTGTLTINSAMGTKTFTGNVTINSGGVWSETAAAAVAYAGNLQNDGMYNANAGNHTFSGISKTIGGGKKISIPTLTINGTTTNNVELTVANALTGLSNLINGSAGVLNIGGTSTIMTLTANAPGNTVSYYGVDQTINNTTYSNLRLSGSGVKTFLQNTTINNLLSIDTGVVANLGTFTYNSKELTLGGVTTPSGSWGSSASSAINKNDTYFSGTTGTLNVSTANCTAPTSYAMTGTGGAFCGAAAGSPIGLANSQSGVSYQLLRGIVKIGSSIVGTGGAISFGTYNATGNYTVLATTIGTLCTATMTGSVNILSYSTPPTPTATVTNVLCPADITGKITLTNAIAPASVAFVSASNQYIDFGTPLLSGRSAFTVEGWIKFDPVNYRTRMSLFGQNDVIEIGFEDNNLRCWTANGGSVNLPLASFPTDNAWHHIALTGDGKAGGLKIYLDGVTKVTGGTATANYGSSSYTSKIGNYVMDPAGGSSVGLTGEVFKLGFWNRAISAAEITNMASGFVVYDSSQAGLLAGYSFNEGIGTTVSGVGSVAPTGTFQNAPTWKDPYVYSWTSSTGFTSNLKNLSGLSAGTYNLTTSLKGCTTSGSWEVKSTNVAPTITTQPIAPAATCSVSGIQSMTVIASGTGLTYDWKLAGVSVANGGVISGQGTSTLTLTNPTATNAGSYSVVVSGTCNPSVTSAPVTVNVNPTPSITTQPTAAGVCFSGSSQSTTLSYSAVTGTPTTYSIVWDASPANSFASVTDVNLPTGATGAITFSVPASTLAGTYTGTITVKNAAGCVSNGTKFTVTVNNNITIQVGENPYRFCVDNPNTIPTAVVNSGQYVVLDVIKGFNYTFAVGNAFSGNEILTLINDADTNNTAIVTNSGPTGTSIDNWISPLSGRIKIKLSMDNCTTGSTGLALTLTLNSLGNTQDSQAAFGTDSWVAHVYNWTGSVPPADAFNPANYVGYFKNPTENINEGFGADTACFPVLSNEVNRVNIYTETFAVRYRMRSSKSGYYFLNVRGDDGVRIFVDGALVFNEWKEQPPTSYCNTLIYLNGNSEIVVEYYENLGQNELTVDLTPFANGTVVNTIDGSAVVNVCTGVSPGTLMGNDLLSGCGTATLPRVSYQWQVSTDGTTFTDIAAATSKDYIVPAQSPTTNISRYYRRLVKQTANPAAQPGFPSNVIQVNTNVNTYVSTDPTLCISTPVAANTILATTSGATGIGAASGLPAGVTVTWAANKITIAGTPTASGTFNYSIPLTGGCGAVSANGKITVNGKPATHGFITGLASQCAGNTSQTYSVVAVAGATSYVWTVDTNSGWVITSGQGTNSIKVTVGNSGNQNVSVNAINACGIGYGPYLNVAISPIPSAPGSAGAYSPTCNGFTAQWASTNYATKYFLDVSVSNTFTSFVPGYNDLDVGNNLAQVLTGLNPGTTYFYRVRAYSNCGTSANSATMTYATAAVPTIAPVATAATTINCDAAQLNWGSVANATGYYIDIATNSTFTNFVTVYNNFYIGYANYYAQGLPAGTLYYRVRATNSCGVTTSNSNIISFTTPSPLGGSVSPAQAICSGTAPISDLTLSGYTATNTKIIKWQKASDLAFTTNVVDISETTATLSRTKIGNLTFNTYFRAVVQNQFNSYCISYSTPVLITVTGSVSAASVSPTLCINTLMPSIIHTTTGFTGIGTSTSLPAGVTANWSGNTITISGTPTESGIFNYNITLTGGCRAASATGTIIVNANVSAGTVSFTTNSICIGSTATSSSSGNTGGVWSSSNASVATINSTTGVIVGVAAGKSTITYTVSSGCGPQEQASKEITVNPILTASVTIAALNNIICEGTPSSFTFTAAPTHGGAAPTYQWKVNGNNKGVNSATFTTVELSKGDVVTVEMTSNASSCLINSPVTSESIIIETKTTRYDNNGWEIPPTSNLSAEITANYSTLGNLEVCDLKITNNAVVTINKGYYFKIENGLNVTLGTLTVESDANLIQVNPNVINTGSIIVKRDLKFSDGRQQYNYLISPVKNVSLKDIYKSATGAPVTVPFVLYHNEANNKFYNSSGAYIAGRALAVKEATEAAFDGGVDKIMKATFVGEPMNGNVDYTLVNTKPSDNNRGFNLIGNPYPSNLDLDAFYSANAADLSPTFHFWDSTANNTYIQAGDVYPGQAYAQWNAVTPPGEGSGTKATGDIMGTKEPTKYVKVGQGFMARTTIASKKVTFTNTLRSTGISQGFFGKGARETVPFDRYWLNMTSPTNITSQIAVVYFEGGDNAYTKDDSRSLGGSDVIYSIVEGQQISINGKNSFVNTDVQPLGSKHFVSGNYTIALGAQLDGVFGNGQNIYLKDKQTGILTNLSEGNYTFNTAAVESVDRFEIIYKPETVLATGDSNKNDLIIYKDGTDFVVRSKSKKITALNLYDTSGRLIINMAPNMNEVRIDGNSLVNAIYVLKINRNGEITTKKVMR